LLKILLNGNQLETEAKTLEDLCRSLGYSNDKIATALNGEFIPERNRQDAVLTRNDKIEIVSPRQGG